MPDRCDVHGLGVNPADRDLLVASHTGRFRPESGEETLARVTDRGQDTMGFTVVGPDRFLARATRTYAKSLPPPLG